MASLSATMSLAIHNDSVVGCGIFVHNLRQASVKVPLLQKQPNSCPPVTTALDHVLLLQYSRSRLPATTA